jgi:tetratricopeptide (TPR) repeat protein
MSAVVPFFKELSDHQLADPGADVTRVREFQRELEEEWHLRADRYGDPEALDERLRRHLERWLDAVSPKTPAADPAALNETGLFLQQQGMWEEAEEVHREAIGLAEEMRLEEPKAIAYGHLGQIYLRQEKLDKAEEMLWTSLAICDRAGGKKGMAACYKALGVLHRKRKKFGRAFECIRAALKIEEELERDAGRVACYENLATTYRMTGDPDKAEQIERLARAIRVEPQYPHGGLFPSDI